MTRSIFVLLSALLSFVSTLRSVLAHPVSSRVSFESTPSLSQDKQITRGLTLSPSSSLTAHENTTGWTWFYVSGDGSQILSIKGPWVLLVRASSPKKKKTNIRFLQLKRNLSLNSSAAAKTSLRRICSPRAHPTATRFSNNHGPATPRPGLAKFLFDCEFGLFDATPASGLGVWTPYPRGKYICNGNLDGQLLMTLVSNTIDYKMAIHDLAFFNKVLHDTRGVEDSAPFFDFVFNYTPELDSTPYERVVEGQWRSKYGDVTVASWWVNSVSKEGWALTGYIYLFPCSSRRLWSKSNLSKSTEKRRSLHSIRLRLKLGCYIIQRLSEAIHEQRCKGPQRSNLSQL